MCDKCLMLSLWVTCDTRMTCYSLFIVLYNNESRIQKFHKKYNICSLLHTGRTQLLCTSYRELLYYFDEYHTKQGLLWLLSIYLLSWLFRLMSRLHARNSVSLLFQYGLICWVTMESFLHIVLWYNITSLFFFYTEETSP